MKKYQIILADPAWTISQMANIPSGRPKIRIDRVWSMPNRWTFTIAFGSVVMKIQDKWEIVLIDKISSFAKPKK